jgi:hypothetical protein
MLSQRSAGTRLALWCCSHVLERRLNTSLRKTLVKDIIRDFDRAANKKNGYKRRQETDPVDHGALAPFLSRAVGGASSFSVLFYGVAFFAFLIA